MSDSYPTQCFNCMSPFDALEAVWCSCNPQRPTKVCPYCMGCFCAAGDEYRERFWKDAPPRLEEERSLLAESRMLIGDLLVRAGAITTTQLLEALTAQKEDDGRRLGEILVESGALDPARLDAFLHSQHTVMPADLSRARIDAALLATLGVEECLKDRIVPLEAETFRDHYIMTLAMADPSHAAAIERVQEITGYRVIPAVAAADEIEACIRAIYPEGSLASAEGSVVGPRRRDIVVRDPACEKVLLAAIRRRASHIHILDRSDGPALFYRIDGMVFRDRSCTGEEAAAVRDSFRAVSGLAERGAPPAGRAVLPWRGLEYTLIIRHRSGPRGTEQFSIKLLDPIAFPPRLDELGFGSGVVDTMRDYLNRDSGLVIVSSPAWSGGFSTVWALATDVISQERSIAMLESPRTITIDGVTQEEFWPERPDTFSPALARAIEAGSRVLAITSAGGLGWIRSHPTLPRNRLVICRIEAQGILEALEVIQSIGYPAEALERHEALVIHQTLLRRLCASCRHEDTIRTPNAGPGAYVRRYRRGPGCGVCGPSAGFRGRHPIVHTLGVNHEVAAALASENRTTIAQACRQAGLQALREIATVAAADGFIDAEEIGDRSSPSRAGAGQTQPPSA